MLGISLAFFAFLWLKGYRSWTLLFVPIAGLIIWLKGQHTAILRFNAWQEALSLMRNNLLTGIGVGNWKVIYPQLLKSGYMSEGWIRLHNSYVEGLIECGVGFIAALFVYIVSMVRKMPENALYASALVAVIFCNGTNSLFKMNALIGFLSIFWIGAFDGRHNN